MTLNDIKYLIAAVDPASRHYFSESKSRDYTYWEETRRLNTRADDRYADEAWRFYIHRYTKDPADGIADALEAVLDADERIAFSHTRDFDRATGYIHHIFECEGI